MTLNEMPHQNFARLLKLVHPARVAGLADVLCDGCKRVPDSVVFDSRAVGFLDHGSVLRRAKVREQLAAPFGSRMLLAARSVRSEWLVAKDTPIHGLSSL